MIKSYRSCKNYKYKNVGKHCIGYCSKFNTTCTVEVKRPCQVEKVEMKNAKM